MCSGLKVTAALQSFDYAYRANGFLRGTNRINPIFDKGTSAGFDEGDAPIFAAYSYDANGNLSHDPFKNLDIAYNHLNLPDTIIQPGSENRITWLYDANGNKLRKEVLNDRLILTGPFTENQYRARFITTDGHPTTLDPTLLLAQDSIVFKPGFHAQPGMRLTAKIDSTIVPVDQTDYIVGIEYRNGDIQAIYHSVGRAVPNGSNWRHEYVITDHLGNTRLRFSDLDGSGTIDSTELLSTHDYYPFGLQWNAGGYKYTYNGKEIDRELGLNWHHYGKRMYDAVLGRFTGVDPLADHFAAWSSYSYVFDNPISLIDPTGMAPETIYEDTNTGEQVEVNDGIDKTILVNSTDFQEAKFFANELDINQLNDPDIVDAYSSFYSNHNSYDEFSFANAFDAVFGGPRLRTAEPIGGAGSLEFIGGGGKVGKGALTATQRALKLYKIQKHHIVPKAVFNNSKYKGVLSQFMKLNAGSNLKKLPTPFHGNHPQYNKYVARQLDDLISSGNLNAASVKSLRHRLSQEINRAYDSGLKLNDYFRKLNP
mgnify:CR=1 FL=1